MHDHDTTTERVSAATLSGRLAVLSRFHPEDREGIAELRRQHAAARVEESIERILADAPPLSVDQRSRLSALLVGSGDVVAGGAR